MDSERLTWLFGPEVLDVIDEYDLEDEDDRIELVEEYLPLAPHTPGRDGRMAVRTVVATQILTNQPPVTWRTVERLTAAGLDREQVVSQLTMVIAEQLQAMLASRSEFDAQAYAAALDTLPLPTADDAARAAVAVARAQPGIGVDEHIEAVVASLSPQHSNVVRSLVQQVLDGLVDGPIAWLPEGTIHVPDLVDGRTFTHRYNDAEAEMGFLNVGFDLGAFTRFHTVRLADGTELEQFSIEESHLGWAGPDGWLDDFEPGDLLAITAAVSAPDGGAVEPVDATITITRAGIEPDPDEEVVASVRAAYDVHVAEPGLPVNGEDLALWLCHHRGELFATPRPPLSELCAAAGLEQRGGEVAHDEEIWRRGLWARRFGLALEIVDEPEWTDVLGHALDALDDPDASVDEVRTALDACADPEILDVLADVLIPHYLDLADEHEMSGADAPGRLFELVGRATTVARRPHEIATAEYLACVLYERCGAPEIAEQHLTRAVQATPLLGPIVERMGWYRFDRGDARGAMRWWRELDEPHPAAATIERFLGHASGPKLGRNDPCWCGSGRKFKQCHQNATEMPALPDRVGWMSRKASLWLHHTTVDVRSIVIELATARATGDPDSDPTEMATFDPDELDDLYGEALSDPIVFDVALHEGGLIRLFLRERSSLLPEDEQLLFASWLTVDRSVHEVLAVDPGAAMTMRNLATGDVVEVRERSGSRTAQVGELYCARVVPDGTSHQVFGGVFQVRTGEKSTVLDLCTDHDGVALCAWVGAINQPPRIVHTPGLIDSMIDRPAIEALLEGLGDDPDDATVTRLLGAALVQQVQTAWLDESVPALDGLTPRQAAADPTRRQQVARLLDEFDRMQPIGDEDDEFDHLRWNTAALRRELELELELDE